MAQESGRCPLGVTEMHVRMDCNGCVNRIKKALHGVEGVYDVQFDFPQQKLTVIGRATPEKIVKAIKKTKKIATISSHTEAGGGHGAPEEPPSESAPVTSDPPPAADAADHQPPTEAPPAEAPAAPPAEQTQEPPTPEDAGAGDQVKPPAAATSLHPEDLPAEAKDVGEIHMIHHHYPDHHHRALYQDLWTDYRYPHGYGGQQEAPFSPVINSNHSRYTPATHISEYGYLQPIPQSIRYRISSSTSSSMVAEPYSDDDFYRSSRSTEGNNTITSMFSDENPNACTIV